MIPVFIVLLFLGLSMEHKTEVLAGSLPRPIIWAEPGSLIVLHMPVTIWCQGSWKAQEYRLHKEGIIDPWDRQYPLETKNKAKFYIQRMSALHAGIYKCSYMIPGGRSEHSDTLQLVLIGAYEEPSLSIWPRPAVSSGESITMNCSSPLRFGIFILIQDGNSNLSWTLDLEQQVKKQFQAHFVLDSVTTNHNGTFRCYGYFRNDPQVWSSSSDPVNVLVSESKNQSGIHTESGLGRYQKVLIGVLVTLLLIFFLVLLLLLFCYLCKSKEKNTDTSVKDTHPEESLELDSWNPPDEDPQRIVYAQVKPSRIQKETTSKEPQEVTYAQLSSKTLKQDNS
ncbi:leukocyte immunoglobulin-like receptor subfamily B member 4 [Cricetulus griseus]|uniref:leukocyte immunoglobulin-like receptor subfamily B member 4 n=1 Tax=Cricetulus griseus TaxID=10029 RepID=UPI00022F631F|nr:leukocyte immunoglobulin-like receptor subfamily B member 4 [Cricetulus griseus]